MPLENLQNGRYRSVRELGSGSMGEVYLVDDTVINRQVAIKIMRADPAGYPDTKAVEDAVKLFTREAQAIARLEHTHILPLYDFGKEQQNHTVFMYMVMPYCREGSLATWLQEQRSGRPLPPDEVAYFIEQAAEALHYAHEHGVIHQDVKSSNFLLRTRTDGQTLPTLLLADFGIARMSSATTVSTTSASPRGTPRYMPVEQWEGRPVAASDQYALAVMAYHLLTATYPFKGVQMLQLMYQHMQAVPEPPGQINPLIPPALDTVILRALAKKPDARFPSIRAFAVAFRQALQGVQPIQPPRQHMPETHPAAAYNAALSKPPEPSFPGPAAQPPLVLRSPSVAPTSSAPTIAEQRSPTPAFPVAYPQLNRSQQPGPLAAHSPVPSPQSWPGNQPQPAPARPAKGPSRGKAILAITLALLVALVGASAFYFFVNSGQGNVNLTPTPNSKANPYVASMPTLLFTDPLSKPAMWQTNLDNKITNGSCLFQQGAYHVTTDVATTYTLCDAAPQQPTTGNLTFEVQMQILHGDCGGLAFRGDFQQGNFYYFDVCSDGGYYLFPYTQFHLPGPNALLQSTLHSSISNVTMALVAQGSSFTLYLNHKQVGHVTDSTYTSGQIALFAYSLSNPSTDQSTARLTEVIFSNARLWTA